LAKNLLEQLKANWTLIDRDEIVEQSDEEHADEYLREAVEVALKEGNKVIIDTQLPFIATTKPCAY
jgi:hypothetical protein